VRTLGNLLWVDSGREQEFATWRGAPLAGRWRRPPTEARPAPL